MGVGGIIKRIKRRITYGGLSEKKWMKIHKSDMFKSSMFKSDIIYFLTISFIITLVVSISFFSGLVIGRMTSGSMIEGVVAKGLSSFFTWEKPKLKNEFQQSKMLHSRSLQALQQLQPSQSSQQLQAPSDWIKQDKIRIYNDRVVIFIKEPYLSYFAPTGSMKPTLDEKSNAIEITPESKEQLHVGDIIAYKSRTGETVIHRIIKIGYDNKGWYCIVKGDNNEIPDEEKVRFEQIQRVVVGIIY